MTLHALRFSSNVRCLQMKNNFSARRASGSQPSRRLANSGKPDLAEILRSVGFYDPSAAIDEIRSIMPKVGPSEYNEWYWHFLENEEPSHKDIVERLREAEAAEDPFTLFTSEFRFLRGALNASMRRQWASAEKFDHPKSLAGTIWTEIGEESQTEVRRAILALARYHELFVPGLGRPVKDGINQLLFLLADFFARYSNFQGSLFEMPTSPNSLFIRFADAALEHSGFHRGLRTPKALAARWRRLREAFRSAE